MISWNLFLATYVDEFGVITLLEVVQNTRFVQVRQVGHVFDFFELWRVHLVALIFLQFLFLRSHFYGQYFA